MKQETKELIEWIKCQISISQDQSAFITKDAEEKFRTNQIKAIQFLDSLPEIESHLCNGGYIQDINGTPCCDGDVIINESILDKQKEKGILYWSKKDSRFYFKKVEGLLNSLSVNFKKVD